MIKIWVLEGTPADVSTKRTDLLTRILSSSSKNCCDESRFMLG
jgi:hypothetical protein